MNENTKPAPGSVLNERYVIVQPIANGAYLAADQRLLGRMWRIVDRGPNHDISEDGSPDATDRFTIAGRWYEVFPYANAAPPVPASVPPPVPDAVPDRPPAPPKMREVGSKPAESIAARTAGARLRPSVPPGARRGSPSPAEWGLTVFVGVVAIVVVVIFLLNFNKPSTGNGAPATVANNANPGGLVLHNDSTQTGGTNVPSGVQSTMTAYAGQIDIANSTIAAETPLPTASLSTNSDSNHDGTSWPAFGGGLDQTRVSKTGPALPLRLAWQFDATHTAQGSKDIQIYGSAAIAGDGTVYVGTTDGAVLALDASGKQIWLAQTGDAVVAAPAIGSNGIIYAASTDHSLYAFDQKDGHKLWAFPTFDELDAAPVVFEGVVYVGSKDGNLWAINAQNGLKRWSFATEPGIAQKPSILFASPAISNGLIYIGSGGGILYALDTSGKMRWSVNVNSSITAGVAVDNGTIYFGAANGHIYANDSTTGAHKWEATVPGQIRNSSPAVAGGLLYIGSGDNHLYAYDANTGVQKWVFATNGPVSTSPVVAGFSGDLALATVYIGSNDRSIYGLNAKTGQKVWSYESGNMIFASPAVAAGRMVIGSTDGRIYSFSGK